MSEKVISYAMEFRKDYTTKTVQNKRKLHCKTVQIENAKHLD